jgi:ankyrin repeat protein
LETELSCDTQRKLACLAAMYGSVHIIDSIGRRARGILSLQDKHGLTPAHYAMVSELDEESHQVVLTLHEYGGIEAVCKENRCGITPAHLAVQTGRWGTVLLMCKMAPPGWVLDTFTFAKAAMAAIRNDSVDLLVAVSKAAGPKFLVSKIPDSLADDLELKDSEELPKGTTWVHYAAEQGRAVILREIFGLVGEEAFKVQTAQGHTPAHVAVSYNSLKCLKVIGRVLGALEIPDYKDKWLPAHLAASLGSEECLAAIEAAAMSTLLVTDAHDMLPVNVAVKFKQVACFELLLQYLEDTLYHASSRERNLSLDLRKNFSENMLLDIYSHCRKYGSDDCMLVLFKRHPKLILTRTSELIRAAEEGRTAVLECLVRPAFVSVLRETDKLGRSPAFLAALKGHQDTLRWIVKQLGSDAKHAMLFESKREGCAAMHAVAHGMIGVLSDVFGREWNSREFMEGLKLRNGTTVAHLACLYSNASKATGIQVVHKVCGEAIFRAVDQEERCAIQAALFQNDHVSEVLQKLCSCMGKEAVSAQITQGEKIGTELLLVVFRQDWARALHTHLGNDVFLVQRGKHGNLVWQSALLGIKEPIKALWELIGEPMFTTPCFEDNNFMNAAAGHKKVDMLKLAHELAGPEIFKNVNKSGQNAAHLAAAHGYVEVLAALEDLGLMTLLFAEKDLDSRTPADAAKVFRKDDAVKFLQDRGFGPTKNVSKTQAKLQKQLLKQRERKEEGSTVAEAQVRAWVLRRSSYHACVTCSVCACMSPTVMSSVDTDNAVRDTYT